MELFASPSACELPTSDQPLRVAEFHDLFTDHLLGHDRVAATTLDLAFPDEPGLAVAVGDLTERETACCSFFSFSLCHEDGGLLLRVAVPATYVEVLDGLERLAGLAARPEGEDR
jgi:hypothetical protein